jgi:hypothetical protein
MQNKIIQTANTFFENEAKFKYLGTTSVNKLLYSQNMKIRINLENV